MPAKTKKIPHARLKGLRAEQGLSMADMAKIVGITPNTYLLKENGARDFVETEMKTLVKFFKVSGDELFFGNIIQNVARSRDKVLRE